MTIPWKALSIRNRLSLLGIAMLMFLLGMYIVIWQSMDHTIETLRHEVTRLDQEGNGLISKIGSLKAIEREITVLRENLSSRVQQFPENLELNSFRGDVVEIAKQRNVVVRIWKPEIPLLDLQHSETSIPITIRLEGDFEGTLQFLDELRQVPWLQRFASMVITRRENTEDSSLIITNIAIHGFTPLGIEHVQNLLEA